MLHLAFLSFIRRPLTRLILLFLIALACALPVFLLQTAGGLYDGINRAVSPFPILVGAKGSSYQLVLNTVFLRDKPIGNITHDDMEKLASDPHTEAVYPLAFGDNYRGFRIAGTNADIFDFRPDKKKGPWLSIAEGRCFAEEGDVVIGSETARLTGLRIGDTFHSVHGASAKGRAHNHTLKVVGILAPVKGPYDTAILTDIRDVWEAHGTAAEAQKEVTALLVVPKGYKEAMQLLSLYQRQKDVQMLFPSQTIISLYAMVGQTKDFWEILRLVFWRFLSSSHFWRCTGARSAVSRSLRSCAHWGRERGTSAGCCSRKRRYSFSPLPSPAGFWVMAEAFLRRSSSRLMRRS